MFYVEHYYENLGIRLKIHIFNVLNFRQRISSEASKVATKYLDEASTRAPPPSGPSRSTHASRPLGPRKSTPKEEYARLSSGRLRQGRGFRARLGEASSGDERGRLGRRRLGRGRLGRGRLGRGRLGRGRLGGGSLGRRRLKAFLGEDLSGVGASRAEGRGRLGQ